jgi:Recombinase zinc beta ribbon domain
MNRTFERIIDDETWSRVAALRDAHARTKKLTGARSTGRRPSADFLFAGKHLRCGECGHALMPRTSASYERYVCYGRNRDKESCSMPSIRRTELDAAVFEHFRHLTVDIDATRERFQEAISGRLAEVRALLDDAEREAQAQAASMAKLETDYLRGDLPAKEYAHLRERVADEQTAAEANVERLRAREKDIATGASIRDAEQETLEALAAIRAAIAGEVSNAEGIAAARATLMRLFDHFTVHRLPDRSTLPAHERELAEHVAA